MIPDPDAEKELSPHLTPLLSAGTDISQKGAMRIQVLLLMVQDHLFKEEEGELLEQRVHVVNISQELRHGKKNFVKLLGDYLGEESSLCRSMAIWPRHIDHFERQYIKAFEKDPLFGVYFIDRVHKRVQVLMQSYNTKEIENID